MRAPWVRLLVGWRFAPFDLCNTFHLPHRLHHLAKVRKIVYLNEDSAKHGSIFGVQVCSTNVGAGLADGLQDIRVTTATVLARDGEPDREGLARSLLPVDVHPPLIRRECQEVGTVCTVNRDAPTLRHVSHHGVPR